MASNPFADEPGFPRRSSSERAKDLDRLHDEELDTWAYQNYLDSKLKNPKTSKPYSKKPSFSKEILGTYIAVGLLIVFLISIA
jgi:hypothetical protein